ncbi:MAG: hypothetical protein ACE5FS_09780 [Paracoccaceae bacterium]
MLYLIAFLCGAAIGWGQAAKRGGRTPDRLQYAAVYGIIATLLFLVALVVAGAAGLV